MDLMRLTYSQLVTEMQRRYGRGVHHATALYRAFHQSAEMHLDALPAFADSPDLCRQVSRDLRDTRLVLLERFRQDDVIKLVFGLSDGCRVETVVIPMANHATVCISCQVGCRMGCRFCRTAQMGLVRNLTVAEMVAQVHAVKVRMGLAVRNVVFMGMGEPLDNFGAVVQAVRVMEDQRGLDIAKRHMTLSTSGLVPDIERLAALDWPQLKLAVSLNAPNDPLRDSLMPVNRLYPLAALKRALHGYPLARGNSIFLEYVLISGVNDHPRHARELADYIGDLPAKLNLIPYNPRPASPFRAPSALDLDGFRQALVAQGIFVRVRTSKGADIRAACGQLGGTLRPTDGAGNAPGEYGLKSPGRGLRLPGKPPSPGIGFG